MPERMFCLACGRWEMVVPMGYHVIIEHGEIETCEGPFTYSAPPEIDPNEYSALIEPDPEEYERYSHEEVM